MRRLTVGPFRLPLDQGEENAIRLFLATAIQLGVEHGLWTDHENVTRGAFAVIPDRAVSATQNEGGDN